MRVCVCVHVRDDCVCACTDECASANVSVCVRERVLGYYFLEEKSRKSGAGYGAPRVVVLLLQEEPTRPSY